MRRDLRKLQVWPRKHLRFLFFALVLLPTISLTCSCATSQEMSPNKAVSNTAEIELPTIPISTVSPGSEEVQIMGKNRLSDVSDFLPILETTAKEPAWVGVLLEEGCQSYFQYRFHDGEYWLEYMLFPEEQLFLEGEFRSAVEEQGLAVNDVQLTGGDKYLEVPLGSEVTQAVSISLEIIGRSCKVDHQAKVEFLNELD